MKKIIITNEATVNTNGKRAHHSCKPVVRREDGQVWNSCLDAAEAVGVTQSTMSACCTGKIKAIKGNHYFYLSKRDEYMDSLLARIRELSAVEEDAAKWRAQEAEKEAIRKAEEKRLADIAKAEEAHRKAVEKAKAKVDRLTMEVERKYNLYLAAMEKLQAAAWALKDLEDENATEMEAVA